MRPLDRIRQLEAKLPADTTPSPWAQLAKFMTSGELKRILDAWEHERPLPVGELERLAARGFARGAAGLTPDDVREQFDAAERDVSWAFWSFTMALGHRHGHTAAPAHRRFDLLDLTLAEVHVLVRLAASAMSIEDLQGSAEIISKLRCDGSPMTIERFGGLVLGGECSPPGKRHH
jgi:hypothetical protein